MYRPASVGSIARVMRPEKRGPRINPVVYVALGLRERLVKSRPPVNMPLLAASVGCFATLDDDDTAGAAGHRPRVSPHSSRLCAMRRIVRAFNHQHPFPRLLRYHPMARSLCLDTRYNARRLGSAHVSLGSRDPPTYGAARGTSRV